MVGSIAQAESVPSTPALDVVTPDDTKPCLGRPRVSYTLASTRTKYEIKKKARQICNESNNNMKKQLDNISQGCSDDVLVDISRPKISPSKQQKKVEVNITLKILNSLKRTLCTVDAKEEESGGKRMRLQEEIIKGKELAAKMMRLSRTFQ
ncbi:hypothetical protein OS493_001867 [Desmophyllum pertusum]|uniref:Uncharacterized protein n=1 Tax=Desmophyllum pertusum TaxID=174260 RepID=A0A9W9Z7Y5_9CNID|nr:hypothetical protein OS493_001867 [Desmophyllum pertusum]